MSPRIRLPVSGTKKTKVEDQTEDNTEVQDEQEEQEEEEQEEETAEEAAAREEQEALEAEEAAKREREESDAAAAKLAKAANKKDEAKVKVKSKHDPKGADLQVAEPRAKQRLKAKHNLIFCPYSKVRVPVEGTASKVEISNWMQSQIEAGLVEIVKE